MNDIDAKFIACVQSNDLDATIELLKSGANVRVGDDAALIAALRTEI